jgi:hypothetical protein
VQEVEAKVQVVVVADPSQIDDFQEQVVEEQQTVELVVEVVVMVVPY